MTTRVELHRLAEIRRLCSTGEARAIREAAGLRRAEFASALSITPNRLCHYELGLRAPSGDLALRYLRLLDDLRTAASR